MDNRGRTTETRFTAMGSAVHLIVVGGDPDLVDGARDRIARLEARWSRFLPDSEISRLNDAAGSPVAVSADTRLLLARAADAWRSTGGGFDPTLLDALRHAGYDRSFDEVNDAAAAADGGSADAPWRLPALRPDCTDIQVDGDAVTFPAGMGFDPGGIGKGLAADLVATELVAAGADGACVNMGGDIRVVGTSPSGSGWTLSIDIPGVDAPLAMVGLHDGAVATSTVLRRVWTRQGERRHHLIDPATGASSDSDLVAVSVIAAEAWAAEVLAKAILLRGSQRAFDLLDGSTQALTVDRTGTVTTSDGFSAFTGGIDVTTTDVFGAQP